MARGSADRVSSGGGEGCEEVESRLAGRTSEFRLGSPNKDGAKGSLLLTLFMHDAWLAARVSVEHDIV
jgi:hypothetical protein